MSLVESPDKLKTMAQFNRVQVINEMTKKWNEEKIVTITTEFGPPNYMPTIPFTEKPLSDQWENNIFIMNMLKKRIKKMN